MKFNSILTLIFMVLVGLLNQKVVAQTDAEQITPLRIFESYGNPPGNEFRPVKITIAEAINEFTNSETEAGFNTLYFGKDELLNLMEQDNCVGLRFYNVLEDSTSNKTKLLAVGIIENGAELKGQGTKNYLLSRSTLNGTITPIVVDFEAAQVYAMNAYQNEQIKVFGTVLSKVDLTNLMKGGSCRGIKFGPGSRYFEMPNNEPAKKCYSLLAMPIGKSGSDMNTTYLKSLEPCPTFCPNANLLLVPMEE